jgi:hypothetical protein
MSKVSRRLIIEARFRSFKHGLRVLCGQHTCGALLGASLRPKRDGMPWGEWYMGAVQPNGDPYRDWLMLPPDHTETSAAFGFRRYEANGQPIYAIIRPRWQRDRLSGLNRLDQHGQPVRRRGGREPMRAADVWRFSSPDECGPTVTYQAFWDQHIYMGQSAVLPALIDCPKCPRTNRVSVPGEPTPDLAPDDDAGNCDGEWFEHPIVGPVCREDDAALARDEVIARIRNGIARAPDPKAFLFELAAMVRQLENDKDPRGA